MHSDAEDYACILPQLIEEAARRERAEEKWGLLFTHYDALAAYNTAAYEAVGGWDQHLPSYYGDCDFFYRLRLAGYPTIDTGLHVTHHGSSVIKSDPKTHFLSDQKCPGWNDYYNRKWGGSPDYEVFTFRVQPAGPLLVILKFGVSMANVKWFETEEGKLDNS